MYTHGKGCNNKALRDSEIMFRTKSLTKHLRDPDKIENLWNESPQHDRTRSTKMEPINKENKFHRRFPLLQKEHDGLSEYRDVNNSSKNSFLRRTYCNDSKRRTLNTDSKRNTISHTGIFQPSSWSKARREATQDNFYLCREYYDTVKNKNHEEWLESKSKWMGKPFVAIRKSHADKLPRSK